MIERLSLQAAVISSIAAGEEIPATDFGLTAEPHYPIILENGSQSLLATISPELNLVKLNIPKKIGHVAPRSVEQTFYLSYLLNNDIPLVISDGRAGTGKTLLSLAAAVHLAIDKFGPQRQIIMTKSLSEVGKYRIGTVPGDTREKLSPYIESYMFALRKVFGKDASITLLEDREQLKFMPINVLRGTSIDDAIVILDEAQNLAPEEIRTIGTRIGENSRLFLMGDITQSDESCRGSGMTQLMNSPEVLSSPLAATITLRKNERSPLSELIDKALFQEDKNVRL